MYIPKFKLIKNNDFQQLIENGNQETEKLAKEGHKIERVDIDFDRNAIGTSRKPTHLLTILYIEKPKEIKESKAELPTPPVDIKD